MNLLVSCPFFPSMAAPVQTTLTDFMGRQCFACGRVLGPYHKRFCSIQCRDTTYRGPNHHRWRGGAKQIHYPSTFTKVLKERIRNRDGLVCSICETEDIYGHRLHVHHIDNDKFNNTPRNLITLCRQCHHRGDLHNDPIKRIDLSALAHHRENNRPFLFI